MSFIQRTNDVHFRNARCTPTKPRAPPPPPRSTTPYNAFRQDPQRKFGSTQITESTRDKAMRQSKDAQRAMPKYDTMQTERRNRLEGLVGFPTSSRLPAPRHSPRLKSTDLPNSQKFAKKWEGPLGFDDVKRNEKKSRQMYSNSERVAEIRAQRAKGIRSRAERSKPFRQAGSSRMSLRKMGAPNFDAPAAPSAPRTQELSCHYTSSGREQLSGKARSTTPTTSLDLRGAASSFKAPSRNRKTGRRAFTLSRGGIAPDQNQGVHSLLPNVANQEKVKKDERAKMLRQRHAPDLSRLYGAMTPDRQVLLKEEHAREKKEHTNLHGKLGEGHLKDLHVRETVMDQTSNHNVDLLSGVFKTLDIDGSGFIDIVELQRGLDMLKLDSTSGSVRKFMKRARDIDEKKRRRIKENQVSFETFIDLCSQYARGSTLGNMRAAAMDGKHENYLKRSSHMENVAHGIVDGGLSNLRPGHYTNTSLFSSGYSRFNREPLYRPNELEHERNKDREKRVMDAETKKWIAESEAEAKSPRKIVSAEEIARAEAEKKERLAKKERENKRKIQKLRQRLMTAHGISEEEKPFRLAGENRFVADAKQRQRAMALEIADEKQRWENAKKSLKVYESDLFHRRPAPRKLKSRTPNVWNKLINPDADV